VDYTQMWWVATAALCRVEERREPALRLAVVEDKDGRGGRHLDTAPVSFEVIYTLHRAQCIDVAVVDLSSGVLEGFGVSFDPINPLDIRENRRPVRYEYCSPGAGGRYSGCPSRRTASKPNSRRRGASIMAVT
jgi:hypothetical protein